MTSAVEPELSVVVPVHNVADYLEECLDSLLAEAGEEVEVVAVDDHSPDRSGAILDAYAQRDPRVRVTHLATNVGLGRARNAGMEQARGRYVWFVDSDDWLPPGTVPAVLARVAATTPDVLLIDHVEVGVGGEIRRTGSGPVLGSVTEPVTVAQRPDLLRLMLVTSACTKVIRRAFLTEVDLRFRPGWYEDCAFAYPLLVAARRIDALDRVGYCYRRREAGAITGSVNDRHFDVFEQYDWMWNRIQRTWGADDGGDAGADRQLLRAELFRLMIDHMLVIAGNSQRLPAARRREFFDRIVEEYRLREPDAGYRPPGGVDGLKHRLVRADAYPAYAALRLAWRATTWLRRPRGTESDDGTPALADLTAR